MAYEIPEGWSLSLLASYVQERSASIEALATPPLETLERLSEAERAEEERRAQGWKAMSTPWVKFEGKVEEERKRTADAERDARVKRGRVRAADVRWEGALGQLGTTVQVASGNNPRRAPYNKIFTNTTISEARGFGARTASMWGRSIARKAAALDDRFGPDALRLEVFSDLYSAVGDDRDMLAVVEAEAQARKVRLHAELEDLVADTERAILELLPRTEAKIAVRALLAPTASRPGKNRRTEETEEAVVVEETDAA